MPDPVYAFARFTAKAGKEEQIKAELLKLVKPSRQEPGNLSYEVHQSIDQPAILLVHDVWADAEALRKHNETDAIKAMRAAVDPLCAEPLAWSLTHLISEPAASG